MAQYQFRLSTMLRLLEATRDERRAKLGEAYQAEAIVRTRMNELDRELSGTQRRYLLGIEPGAINIDGLVDSQRYEMLVRSEQHVLAGQLRTLAEEIERRREALVIADREVRVMEKLRETQQQRFDQEQLKVEMKAFDELAVQRFQRQESD